MRILRALLREVGYAGRVLRKSPGYTTAVVVSLALGIGATTVVFSVMHGVLLDPFPYRGADRMVRADPVSGRTFLELQKLDGFDGAIATDFYNMILTGGELPEAVNVARMSPNAFEFLGVPPLLGRAFTSAGTPAGQEPEHVVVISYGFWQRHFGGDASVLGRTMQLDHESYQVIGVVPPRFLWRVADAYIPVRVLSYNEPGLEFDARLKPGVERERVEAEALALMRNLLPRLPKDFRVRFRPLVEGLRNNMRGTLLLFLVAVSVLLAVGCANVSILMLARGTARQPELALRAAIGASRVRLMYHLLTEALLLTSAGGVLGVLLAFGGLAALVRLLPQGTFPPEADLRVNVPVLLLATAITFATGILAACVPVLRFSRPDLQDAMQSLSRRASMAAGTKRTQGLLIASQVALTIVLLTGAGTAIRSLVTLYRTDLGYDPHQLLRVTVPTPEGAYPTFESRKSVFEAVHARVASLPEAEFVSFGPFSPPFYGSNQPFEIAGMPSDPDRRVLTQFTGHDYFSVLRIPLRRGRSWSDAETARPANVVVINQAMADRFWPNGDALGQKIRLPRLGTGQWIVAAPASTDWLEIVGIVGNVANRGLRETPAPAAYVPYTLWIADNQALIVRTRASPLALVRAVREQIHAAVPGQPIGPSSSGVRTGEDILRSIGWEREEFVSSLFTAFAGLALALAAIGLYSALSYATALRTREFGIRLALGAQRADIIRLVLMPVSGIVGCGVIVGLVLSLASHRVLSTWAITQASDPVVFIATSLILIVVAAAAALVPARRAAAAAPIAALRSE
jgi:predicted permease